MEHCQEIVPAGWFYSLNTHAEENVVGVSFSLPPAGKQGSAVGLIGQRSRSGNIPKIPIKGEICPTSAKRNQSACNIHLSGQNYSKFQLAKISRYFHFLKKIFHVPAVNFQNKTF